MKVLVIDQGGKAGQGSYPMSQCHQLPHHATAGKTQTALSAPQLPLPNRESSVESGPGCTPPRLYKIPSYIRLVLHVINKASFLSPPQLALFEEKETTDTHTHTQREREKSFCGHFLGGVLISGQSQEKSTGRFLLQIIHSLLVFSFFLYVRKWALTSAASVSEHVVRCSV